MKSNLQKPGYPTLVLVVLMFLVSACSPTVQAEAPELNTPAVEQPSAMETYSDPFAYCAAVGTIDQPDALFTGDKIPDVIVTGFIKASGGNLDAASSDTFKQMTIWRCMDNKVYACNFGANLRCDSKANTDKTPTQEMVDYCKENNDSDFIPMVVTGHDTIYSWHCVKDVPEPLGQISEPDAAGFLKNIWYPIEPGN